MRSQQLLYLSAYQLVAYRWQAGTLTHAAAFAGSEEGYRQFADYLRQHARERFALLVNIAEEGFHVETIPFLRGADREAVIRRKLGQIFFNAPLTASQSLGHEKNKRKDERLLLAALTGSEHLAPWLKVIGLAEVALSGIYSLPLLAPSLFRKLKISEERCLLLTVQDQSIRQSYLENGEIHFSRLAPLFDSSIGGIAQAFSSETLKLQQYLSSQRLISRNQPITVYILAHAAAIATIQGNCLSSDTIRYVVLDSADCARQTGLKTPMGGTHSEALFLNLMAVAPPRIQFADDELCHSFHLRQLRAVLYGLGGVALLGCLLASGVMLYEANNIAREVVQLHDEARVTRQRYDDITRSFPKIPTNNETLRRIIDRYAELERQSASPEGLYREISRALQSAPAIELDAIEWKLGGAETGVTGASTQPAARPVAAGNEAAIVQGFLRLGSNSNPRQILAAFTQFAEVLKANPALQVDILKRPFDVESGKALKGEDTMVEDNKPRSFSVQISRKIGS